jgi:hypothetical protein
MTKIELSALAIIALTLLCALCLTMNIDHELVYTFLTIIGGIAGVNTYSLIEKIKSRKNGGKK